MFNFRRPKLFLENFKWKRFTVKLIFLYSIRFKNINKILITLEGGKEACIYFTRKIHTIFYIFKLCRFWRIWNKKTSDFFLKANDFLSWTHTIINFTTFKALRSSVQRDRLKVTFTELACNKNWRINKAFDKVFYR